MSKKKIITRFAPSPTGYLHIGGARTALFNWLFARHHGGEFHLRIEDTDKARSTPEATQAILDGMSWLGLEADGDVVFQSQNADAHIAAALAMIENGTAYRCYATDTEAEILRDQAREAGHAFRSPWRDRTDYPDTGDYVIRFKVPDGATIIDDAVQGEIRWDNSQFDDLVLLRSDGTPTYMLAVVVDDHNMDVTHVMRGDDHLTNAGRQKQIYEALGWDVPVFAHIPLIHGPDGKKLSKRHGALGAHAYKDLGYLPEGLNNYLLRLGWAHGDQEIFTVDEAINAFTLRGLNKSPARLDFDKLAYVNGEHLKQMDTDALIKLLQPFLSEVDDLDITPEGMNRLKLAMDVLKTRSKTLVELAERTRFILGSQPFEITGKTEKPLRNGGRERLADFAKHLSDFKGDWTQDSLGALLKNYVEQKEIGFGKIGQPLRTVITGGNPAPDIDFTMWVLGREEVFKRIQAQIEE